MKIFVHGKGSIQLGKADFVNNGGQANVYARGRTAYKIYAKPSDMIPGSKINELSVLSDLDIIKPQEIITTGVNNTPVGYTMRYIKDSYALCQLFTMSFKNRYGVTTDTVLNLIKRMQNSIQHIHDNNILVVDPNEMNFLVDKKFDHVFLIDVDSYQTAHYPATVIMESIRDYHTKLFNKNSDWFSFGIVTFQLFTGIHPYKGKHASIKDLSARMKQNISVFNSQVSIPSICPPFSSIPQSYRDWYKAIFEDGKRLPPPFVAVVASQITMKPQKTLTSIAFDIKEIQKFPTQILSYDSFFGKSVVITQQGLFVNGKERIGHKTSMLIGTTPKFNHIVGARIENKKLQIHDFDTNTEMLCDISGSDIMCHEGRIYVKNDLDLYEIQFIEFSDINIKISPRTVANVMKKATTLFDGVVLQNILGSFYACICPSWGTSYQVHLKELLGYRIVDAKYDNRILFVVGYKDSKYDKFIFRLSVNFESYDVRVINDISRTNETNFTVSEKGICVHLNENEELELFFNKMGVHDIKVTDDPSIKGIRLFKDGNQIIFAKENTLYSLTTKKV